MKRLILCTLLTLGLATGCARFKSTVTERTAPDGTVERVTVVKVGTLFDSKSELGKLASGQTDKSQKISVGSLSQESSASNAVGFAESIVGAAIRAAVCACGKRAEAEKSSAAPRRGVVRSFCRGSRGWIRLRGHSG